MGSNVFCLTGAEGAEAAETIPRFCEVARDLATRWITGAGE